MKKIYFSKNKKPSMLRRWRKGAINVLTGFSIEVFPHRTLLVAEKILATPSPSKNALVDLKFSVDELDVYGHKIKIYRAGNFSRSVVFSHGWSGSAGDFNGYYQLLLERGYNVVTLDHIAHGRSAGKTANLFVFTKAMEQVLDIEKNNSEIAGMIAHSMGASAVINSALVQQSTIPAVLVSPVIPFFESLYQSINDFGISEKWLNRLVDVYQTRYGRSIEDIDPKLNINKLFNPLLTIQDRNDRHIPLETNKQYFSPHVAASLHETEGLGHFRILGDQRVISKAINFIDGTSR